MLLGPVGAGKTLTPLEYLEFLAGLWNVEPLTGLDAEDRGRSGRLPGKLNKGAGVGADACDRASDRAPGGNPSPLPSGQARILKVPE